MRAVRCKFEREQWVVSGETEDWGKVQFPELWELPGGQSQSAGDRANISCHHRTTGDGFVTKFKINSRKC